MIDLFFIKTLDVIYLNKTLESFYSTVDDKELPNFNIYVISELETREETLNNILTKKSIHNDLLIIADDIIFTKDWYSSLINNLIYGDIIGFTMMKPKKNTIHNNGFDFVNIDGKLTYLPNMRNKNINSEVKVYRECDAVVGCAMYIKNDVLNEVKEFPKDGYNRWGELLFFAIAKQNNFKTIVLGHKLFHYSISSKQKQDVKLSSMSWLIENKLWQDVVRKYLNNLKDVPYYTNKISNELKSFLNTEKNILVYGCGTVADIILKNTDIKNIDIASGLFEEVGIEFNNIIIEDINNINLKNYDFIVISAIGYEEEIIKKYFHNHKNIIKLSKTKQDNSIEIGVNR